MHRYVAAALVRHARLWFACAFAGALVGICVAVLPQASEASTRLLLSHRPDDEPISAMLTDVRLATSRSVAERVVARLRLPSTPDELLKDYTAEAVSDRVLELTVTADTPAEATRRAAMIAAVVLEYRVEQAWAQREPARRQLDAARTRVEHAAVTTGKAQEAQQAQLDRTRRQVAGLQGMVEIEDAALRQVGESRVLDRAAPVRNPRLGAVLGGVAYGTAGGLVAGVMFVVLRTLLCGPMWQRQAIARALDVPVPSSVGRVGRRRRWHSYLAQLPWPSTVDWLRMSVDHLRETVERQQPTQPTLLIVPVGCAHTCALVVATLVTEYARDGKRILVADLSRRHRLARALGVRQHGTSPSPLTTAAGQVVVHLPGPDDTRRGRLEPAGDRPAGCDVLRIEWAVADVVLTFVDPTPTTGTDHLRSWSPHAVAMVSASWTSATRIRATGGLVRSADVRLDSAMLVNAHRLDRLVDA